MRLCDTRVVTCERPSLILRERILAGVLILLTSTLAPAANNQILGWNNLGMHCMDNDYPVFSILPPYNTVNVQLIVSDALVTASNGFSLTLGAGAKWTVSTNAVVSGQGTLSVTVPKAGMQCYRLRKQ